LYVCERVEKHPVTRNLTLHNCFRTIKVPSHGLYRPFYVVAYLADGVGEMSCRTVLTRPDTLADMFVSDGTLSFADALEEQRLVVTIECSFPVTGVYDILVWVNGELVALSPFKVSALAEDDT
jgi:hypothetical protein